ncbi:hypothetical protein SCHPADRAFT_936339 [Schizopora paradoxa]|uniref:Uncharacterized protein n=1 Tax=Schizopora paradoxa TaxID=27342 RepID=A0A0H2S2Y3_9AGAM|nr:hypothetical protein SCHPADRAFT_936339 [Schizopora paradoxa]
MPFSPKRLKRLFRRGRESPSDTAGIAVGGGGLKPPPERHKKTKMKRAKRTASAVASHSFDVVREVSDVFGPLKSVVNSVGHVTDVYQNVRRNEKEARMLQLEVNAFHDQVSGMIPDVTIASMQVFNSLVLLDRDLDDVEAITGLLMKDRLGSRILYWKERDGRLKSAELKFRGAKERFTIGCSVAAAVPFHGMRCGQLQVGRTEERSLREKRSLERVLKVLTLLGLFGSYGSMASPVLNG